MTLPEYDEATGGFHVFQNRARLAHHAPHQDWVAGFGPGVRVGQHMRIAGYIAETLLADRLPDERRGIMLDLGCGASPLTDALTDVCRSQGWTHLCADGEAVLDLLDDMPSRVKFPSQWPTGAQRLRDSVGGNVDAILAFSVLQYAKRDGFLHSFVMESCRSLRIGGTLLLGDVPNRDQRNRVRALQGQPATRVDPVDICDSDIREVIKGAAREGCRLLMHVRPPFLPSGYTRVDLLFRKEMPW